MKATLTATCDRAPLSYRAGEAMAFTLRATGAGPGARVSWRLSGDDGKCESGESGIDGGAAIVAASISRPGFVRLEADLRDASGAATAHFEGGAGADVADIGPDSTEPPDFDDFWRRRKAALAAADCRADTCEIPSGRPDIALFEVSIPCPGGRPATGLLSIPRSGAPFPAMVRLRGYEASWSPIATQSPAPSELRPDAIVFYLSAHGFQFNREPAYYAALRAACGSNGYDFAFDPIQNSDPEKCYFSGMTMRLLRGLEYVKGRPEWNGRDLTAFGGSLGGLQSIWAAALDHDVSECRPRIPWCCNMAGPDAGRIHGDWFVRWVPALGYYDPVNMARRIPGSCRLEIPQAGLGDYISPPSGIMAFYNSLRCPKRLTFIQGAMHFTLPEKPWQTATFQSQDFC